MRFTMPRRPTRFETLIPQILKEAEVDDAVEPPNFVGSTAVGSSPSMDAWFQARQVAATDFYDIREIAVRMGADADELARLRP